MKLFAIVFQKERELMGSWVQVVIGVLYVRGYSEFRPGLPPDFPPKLISYLVITVMNPISI